MPEPAEPPPRPPPWNDPRVRAIVCQALVSAGVIALGVYLIRNLMDNLEVRGISTGFGFLSSRAGFSINQSLIDYSEATSTYGRTFVVGLLNTLLVSGLGIVRLTALGFLIGVTPFPELAGGEAGVGLHRNLPQPPATCPNSLLVLRRLSEFAAT